MLKVAASLALFLFAAPAFAQTVPIVANIASGAARCHVVDVEQNGASWIVMYDDSCPLSQQQAGNAAVVAAAPAISQSLEYPALVSAGVVVTSAGTPALNSTYAIDPASQANIAAIVTGVAAGEGLPGGRSTFVYADIAGIPHQFTAAQFTAFAAAVRNYLYALDLVYAGLEQGQVTSWPSAQVTIP